MGGERRKEGKKEKKMPGIGNMPSLRKSKSRWALGVFLILETWMLGYWILDLYGTCTCTCTFVQAQIIPRESFVRPSEKSYYTFNTFIPVQIIPTNLFIRSLKKSYYTFNIFISVQIIPIKLFMRFLEKSYCTFNSFILIQIIPSDSFVRS